MRREKKGFSLIESLLSLTISLLILVSSFEFFGIARNVFFKLNSEEKEREAATFSLDKMRIDLADAGFGLLDPAQMGLLEGISEKDGVLNILLREEVIPLGGNLVSGQTRIPLASSHKIKKRRDICIFDSEKGEVKSVASAVRGSIVISSPLRSSYIKEESSLVLLRKISYFLDKKKQTLRRKVNNSPSQPLLEDVSYFNFEYNKSANLISFRLSLESKKEKTYEISVFPKNMALASAR